MSYLIGALIAWVILAGLFTWYQKDYDKILEAIIALPLLVPIGLFVLVAYPIVKIWRHFKKNPYAIEIVNAPSVPEGEFRTGED